MPNKLSNFIGVTQLLTQTMQYIILYLIVYLVMSPAWVISNHNLEL